MNYIVKTFCASVLAVALSVAAYAQTGRPAGGTATPGAGAGLAKAPTASTDSSPDAKGTGANEARIGPSIGRSTHSKTNGLNMGTRSGANSDVNMPRNAPKQGGQ